PAPHLSHYTSLSRSRPRRPHAAACKRCRRGDDGFLSRGRRRPPREFSVNASNRIMTQTTATIPFNVKRLAGYLTRQGLNDGGPITLAPLSGGQSNPTFRIQ